LFSGFRAPSRGDIRVPGRSQEKTPRGVFFVGFNLSSKRNSGFWSPNRKIVEPAGSLAERLLPKHIHAVTAQGFELEVGLFVLVYSINALG